MRVRSRQGVRLAVMGFGLLLILSLVPVSASSANISHSYNTKSSIKTGSLVSLYPKQADYVEAANMANGKQLVGLVVNSNDSLLAVDDDPKKAQVAINGTATALVSTVNGDIAVGDQISVSAFNGIGAKAIPGGRIIGLAQTPFTSGSPGAKETTVTDLQGESKQIHVGYVSVNIAIGPPGEGDDGKNLNGLQRLARSITGHTVSTTRVLISLVVALATVLALVVLIYGSIYGGIISIGRNPLAKHAVLRSLGAVLLMSAVLAGVASVTIYLLLR